MYNAARYNNIVVKKSETVLLNLDPATFAEIVRIADREDRPRSPGEVNGDETP